MRWINDETLLAAATQLAAGLGQDPNHTVAAAAMDLRGRVYSGVNAYHFTGGPCAELVVLGLAATRRSGPLASIVAVGSKTRGVLAPCGRCRQVLIDQHPDISVIVPAPGGLESVPITRLLPYSFVHPDRDVERFLPFSGRYYEDVVEGRKRVTRRYEADVPVGETTFSFEFPDELGYRTLPGFVERVGQVRLRDLSGEDQDGLRRHYPHLPADADLLEAHIRTR